MKYNATIQVNTEFQLLDLDEKIQYVAIDADGTVAGYETLPVAIPELESWDYAEADIDGHEVHALHSLPWEYDNWEELLFELTYDEETDEDKEAKEMQPGG